MPKTINDFTPGDLEFQMFVLDELAAVVGQDSTKMFDEAFGLRVGKILARDEDMLVERHAGSTSVRARFIGGPCPSAAHPRESARFKRYAEGSAPLARIRGRGKPGCRGAGGSPALTLQFRKDGVAIRGRGCFGICHNCVAIPVKIAADKA